jgi:hypothetical protein
MGKTAHDFLLADWTVGAPSYSIDRDHYDGLPGTGTLPARDVRPHEVRFSA